VIFALLLSACSSTAEPSTPTTTPLSERGGCEQPVEVTWALTCLEGTWSGWAWVARGCADQVVFRAWEPTLRHERHELRLEAVDTGGPDGVEAWALGPLAPGVGPADWRPGEVTALVCDDPDTTWALSVEQDGALQWCEASGPEVAALSGLPGAPALLEGCTAVR
jgi:hypothetical protein